MCSSEAVAKPEQLLHLVGAHRDQGKGYVNLRFVHCAGQLEVRDGVELSAVGGDSCLDGFGRLEHAICGDGSHLCKRGTEDEGRPFVGFDLADHGRL